MSRRILIINGNPAYKRETFSAALATAYVEGAAAAGHETRIMVISKLVFDPILHEGYTEPQTLEPDIVSAQEAIGWAEHIVFIYPMWLFNIPALLKGFCERTLTPGFAYDLDPENPLKAAQLTGKSARIIQTMGMPGALYDIMFGAHGGKAFKSMLSFVGMSPVRSTFLGMVQGGNLTRIRYLDKMRALGSRAG